MPELGETEVGGGLEVSRSPMTELGLELEVPLRPPPGLYGLPGSTHPDQRTRSAGHGGHAV